MRRSAQPCVRPAFTLIELLVVVAIIAALLAILMPSMGIAIQKAQSVHCRSNLRQIHIAALAYGQDHMTILPERLRWVLGGSFSPYGPGWYEHTEKRNFEQGSLFPYLQTIDIHLCPTFAKVYEQNPAHVGRKPVGGYSMNSFVGPYHTTINGVTPQANLTMMKDPTTLIMFADDNPFVIPAINKHKINDNAILYGRYNNPGDLIDSIGAFHSPPGNNPYKGSANAAFADGHGEEVPVAEGKFYAYPADFRF